MLRNKDYVGLSWIIAKPPYAYLRNQFTLNAFGRRTISKGSLYAQLGIRPVKANIFIDGAFFKKIAFVAGYSINKRSKRVTLSATAEIRYYGEVFNFHYNDINLLYRKPAADVYGMYANTTGTYLYPLRKFETPFSQWAVFTEYDGYDIGAVSLSGTSLFHLSQKMNVTLEGDFNFIKGRLGEGWSDPLLNRTTNFLYPFFRAEFCYTPAENLLASVYLINKAINLDVHYPTHYLLSRPCLGIRIHAAF